jgi:hypothetical protein
MGTRMVDLHRMTDGTNSCFGIILAMPVRSKCRLQIWSQARMAAQT